MLQQIENVLAMAELVCPVAYVFVISILCCIILHLIYSLPAVHLYNFDPGYWYFVSFW